MSGEIWELNRTSDWSQVRVQVLGLGIAGFACADNLAFVGAQVTAWDERQSDALKQKADLLDSLGAVCVLGEPLRLMPDIDLLVVSPGFPPSYPVIQAAQDAGIPVWGELEVAWRLQDVENPPAWLCVTGTNGKTTTTLMLESMLLAAGLRATAAGNIGRSLVEAVMDPVGYQVIAVEVGAPQLPFVYSMSPYSAVCLNIAEDHVDHFGSMAEYIRTKSKVYDRTQVAIVFNAADSTTKQMAEDADVIEGCVGFSFSLGVPAAGQFGVVEEIHEGERIGYLVDRRFVENWKENAISLAEFSDIKPFAIHNVENALAAAAMARSFGVPPEAVKQGLLDFQPAPHRVAHVASFKGVAYVDDSKATNAHAAETAIKSFDRVIWIAGGDAKGQDFSDLVAHSKEKLAGVILLGRDRELIKSELQRQAPSVPLIEISNTDPAAMYEVVQSAVAMAVPGDTVLLAPACASWDMFQNYSHRGEVFAAAVLEIGGSNAC